MPLAGAALVIGTAALGLGLAVHLPGLLSPGERLIVGLVIAAVAVDLTGFGLALLLGMHPILIATLLGLTLGCAAGLMAWRGAGPTLLRIGRAVLVAMRARQGRRLLAILVLLGGVLAFLFARVVERESGSWIMHYATTWGDWSFHASSTTTFVFGQNFPPQNPLFAGRPFRYPFAADFASSLLMLGGWELPAALAWPSWGMAMLALTGLILWARRLTEGLAAGVIAVTLSLLGGGLGFWYFFGDAARLGILSAIAHVPRSYDHLDPPVNIQWPNPVLAYYLPQRAFVFGAAIVMAILLLLTPVLQVSSVLGWRSMINSLRHVTKRLPLENGATLFLLAGALTGTLPWFHVHSLVVLAIVTVCWAVLFPRLAWLAFLGAAALLAVPRLLAAVPGDASAPANLHYPRFQFAWLAGPDIPAWFWFKNTGLFWPLLLAALLGPFALRGRSRLILAPFLVVFVVANLVVFQPWDWDNTKLLIFWYLAGAVAVSALLIAIWRAGWWGRFAAPVVWLTLVASGVLSLLQFLPPQAPSYVWFTSEEIALADDVKRLTPSHAVFLTGDQPNNPIADLAGRSVLMSYRGWLWTYGIDYRSREADIARIYRGEPEALALLRGYHVNFVVIGPEELTTWRANLQFFDERLPLWARTAHYRIYAVPG